VVVDTWPPVQVGSRIADARVNILQMVQNKKGFYLDQADTYIKPGYPVSVLQFFSHATLLE
jgi:hypothetical protein